jgi:hypothetical protein
MKNYFFTHRIIRFVFCVIFIGFVFACQKNTTAETEPNIESDVQTSATLWMNPLAIAVPSENPLWFELSDDGPVLISSPEDASLRSFVPWPSSIHVKDMLLQENRLVMAVNRLGFLAFIPWDSSRLGMYSVFDKAYWGRYSIASLFLYEQKPSVILYRDDFFFADTDAPLPKMPVMALVKGSIQPVKAEIPAFKDFSSLQGWDIEALIRGKNGFWNFTAAQKSSDARNKSYYQAKSLTDQPASISMGNYWAALEPESIENASLLLKNTVMTAINSRQGDFSYLIEAIFPNGEQEIRYSYHSSETDNDMHTLFAYTDDNTAVVISSSGNGAIGTKNEGDLIAVNVFNLPELPKDFFYTGIALADNTIIASWEEQQSYQVGAAGFVMINVSLSQN